MRTLCETRWTSRADALYTFKTSFPVVVHALERLQGLEDDKARQYLASITRFVFVIAQVVSEHILQSTVFLSKFLQGIECDLLEATKECKTVIELLRAERLDESIWDELYQSALDLSEPFDIVENMPRRCGRRLYYQSQSPCRHAKTILESVFVLCVYRPHDNGIGVASDKIRKSLLCTVSASSCYRKYYERTNRDIVCDIPD
jgi:hypothetical protein